MQSLLNILKNIRPDGDFENSKNFIEDGYLDSVDLMTLIAEIEEKYNIEISLEQIEEENFKNIDSIEKIIIQNGGDLGVSY